MTQTTAVHNPRTEAICCGILATAAWAAATYTQSWIMLAAAIYGLEGTLFWVARVRAQRSTKCPPK